MHKIILTLLFFFVLPRSFADALINPFPEQRLIYSSSLGAGDYPLTLSTFKKINGQWLTAREEIIDGRLEKYTFELDDSIKLDSAFRRVQRYFQSRHAQLLFDCDGLSCGRSNAWANERFGVKQLYGLDSSQHYQVWSVRNGKVSVFVSVYLVKRGNHRIYLQLENLFPRDSELKLVPASEVVAKEFYREGRVQVMGLSFEQGNISLDDDYLASYAHAFNQQAFRKLTIIAYDALPGSDEEKDERSRKYARVIYEALLDLGVHSRRMTIEAAGSPPSNLNISDAAVFVALTN